MLTNELVISLQKKGYILFIKSKENKHLLCVQVEATNVPKNRSSVTSRGSSPSRVGSKGSRGSSRTKVSGRGSKGSVPNRRLRSITEKQSRDSKTLGEISKILAAALH